jgi:hypothetical protein
MGHDCETKTTTKEDVGEWRRRVKLCESAIHTSHTSETKQAGVLSAWKPD